MNLISLIKEYKDKKELEDKIELLEKIFSEKHEKFHNKTPINYNTNLELYFYSLFYIFSERTINMYKNNYVNKKKIESQIQKASIEKTRLLFLNKDKKYDETIKILDKELKYLPYIYGSFNEYLRNISIFINMTYENFNKRFDVEQLKDEKELLLFTDFMFFLSAYEFKDYGQDYINIWNDTFVDITIEDKNQICKSFSFNNHNFKIKDNTLISENAICGDGPYLIDNSDDYSFISLINYLFKVDHKQNFIELNQFLKIDRYMDKLYIKKIWNCWEQFLIKVFSSNLVKALFYKVFDHIDEKNKLSPYYFIDENEIKIIINNI